MRSYDPIAAARRDLHRHWMTLVRRGDDPDFIAGLIAAAVAFEPRIVPPDLSPLVVTRYTGHGYRHGDYRPDIRLSR